MLTVLVVSAEQRHGRMMPESLDVALGFLLDAFKEFWEDGIDTARKHDSLVSLAMVRSTTTALTILPDQHTHLVAQIVKDVRLENTSTPNPNHVLVPLDLHDIRMLHNEGCRRRLTSISIHLRNRSSVPLD